MHAYPFLRVASVVVNHCVQIPQFFGRVSGNNVLLSIGKKNVIYWSRLASVYLTIITLGVVQLSGEKDLCQLGSIELTNVPTRAYLCWEIPFCVKFDRRASGISQLKKTGPAVGWGHSREIWVEVCRLSLQAPTQFKTKTAHFATAFKTRDTTFWPWFFLFCIQNKVIFHTRIVEIRKKYQYCKWSPLIAKSKKTPCSRRLIVKLYALLRTQDLESHTLFSGTYLYRPSKGVPPSGWQAYRWLKETSDYLYIQETNFIGKFCQYILLFLIICDFS